MTAAALHVGVSGASGFIGRRLCNLILSEGHRLRALVRNRELAERSLDPRIELIEGDLENAASLCALVDGLDAMMHVAGAVRGRTLADFDRVNVAGTARLLEAIDATSPQLPLLYFSSLAAREPTLSYYAGSKHRAELLLHERRQGRPTTILRPPAVYGPGDREMLPVFRFMAQTGLAPVAGEMHARLSLIFVDDLVRAALCWLAARQTTSALFTLHDGHAGGYSWAELCALVSGACGRTIRPWHVPRGMLDAVARSNEILARALHYAPMLTPGKVRELRHLDWVCSNDDIGVAIDWKPHVCLADGLAMTPGWL